MNDIVRSGQKFTNARGVSAIKDGVKRRGDAMSPSGRKPPWLRVRLGGGEKNMHKVVSTW